jgi:drug/metabolite transporter (DMT)-like permease
MRRSYPALLLTLSAIWGASYLFIKVGVRAFEPFALVEARLLFATPVLVAFLAWRGELRELRSAAVPGLVLGAINVAVPFALITWGEKHIDSGVAAIANASVPLFVFLLALRFAPAERASGARLAGLLIGIAGIAVLSGIHPRGGAWAVAGTLAVVLASIAYAAGGLYGQTQTARFSPATLAAASVIYGAVLMLPLSLFQLPHALGGWKPLTSVAALVVAGTGFAQLLLFQILRYHGASRTSLVTYLMPPIAVFYGALLLGEPLTVAEVAGMGLILVGVALGSGVLRLPRRVPVTQTP